MINHEDLMGMLLCAWIAFVGTTIAYFWYQLIKKRNTNQNNKAMSLQDTLNELTVEKAIEIQTEQLKRWEAVLKPEVFANLKAHCEHDNKAATQGKYVFRGSDMDNYIANYNYGK
jgi:5-methylthioribose kinase